MLFSEETRGEREALRHWLALAEGTIPQDETTFRIAIGMALRMIVGEVEPGKPIRLGDGPHRRSLEQAHEFLRRVEQAEAAVSAARKKLREIAEGGHLGDPQARRAISEVLAELEKTGEERLQMRDERVCHTERARIARMVLKVRALHLGERGFDEILRRIKEETA